MERLVGVWSDWWERGVTGGNVEWQVGAWNGRCERGVTGGNVEWLAGTWSDRQECENDGEEVSAIQDAQRIKR